MDSHVVIVGGGLSGLFIATELMALGIDDVIVVDRNPAPGGVARTIHRDGYSLEPAAGTLLLPHPQLSPVLERIGAVVAPAVDGGLRYVFTRGRLVPLPSSPKAAFAPLVPWGAKLRAGFEPLVRTRPTSPDESLEVFLRRRIGEGLGHTLGWVAASGVFAGDPTRLSARSAFPALPALEDAAGSIVRGGIRRLRQRPRGAVRPTSHVPVGGMTTLAVTASDRLGDRYRPDFEVTAVRRTDGRWGTEGSERITADHVVLACGPRHAAALLGGDIGSLLGRSVSAPVVVVGLGGDAKAFPLPAGFGALTGPDAGTATLGVLFESSYAPDRAPTGYSLVKVIAGGATRPDVVEYDDDRLVAEIGRDLTRILGVEVEASFVEIVRHTAGIPQYEVGHGSWLAEIDRAAAGLPGLHLAGWGYRGVGVAHLATDASAIAARIAARRDT